MNKKIVQALCIVVISICIFIFGMYADILDDVKKSSIWKYPDAALQFFKYNARTISEDLKKQVGWIDAVEPYVYKMFLDQLDIAHQLAALEIKKLSKNDETLYSTQSELILANLAKKQAKIEQDAQKKMHPKDFEKFKLEVKKEVVDSPVQLTILDGVNGLWDTWKKYGVGYFKQQLNRAINKYKSAQAEVIRDAALPYNEKLFRNQRFALTKQGQEKFLGTSLSQNQVLTLGLVGTGGGYRAMILTSGYARAAEDMGLLDGSMYFSTLSGSTWFLGPWISLAGTVKQYQDFLREAIRKKEFTPFDIEKNLIKGQQLVNDILWPKFVFGEPIDVIDVYGALLARVLFAKFGDKYLQQHLSDQWLSIQNGKKPFPIYTAISMHKQGTIARYNWYEFNPLEFRNVDADLSIPAYSFNWKFHEGRSEEPMPEESLGYVLGIAGSAFTINVSDAIRLIISDAITAINLNEGSSLVDKIKYAICSKILELVYNFSGAVTKRVAAAQINNPFKKLSSKISFENQQWLDERDYITLVDAGIDYNIPILPLLRPSRKVQAIIIGESSGNAAQSAELPKMLNDIKRYYKDHENRTVSYTRVDNQTHTSLRFYKDVNNADVPRIIYVNFLKDQNLLREVQHNSVLKKLVDDYKLDSFDPIACVDKGFCGTSNFSYTEEQFLQLSALAEFNMRGYAQYIAEFLKAEFIR